MEVCPLLEGERRKVLERAKKEKVVLELKEKLNAVNSLFLTEYSGLNVAQMSRIRKELRGIQAELNVVKNNLLRIAIRGTPAEELEKFLRGPNAIISVYKDPVSVAKAITNFSKEMPQLRVKAGILGKKIISGEEFQKLATVPNREVLLAQMMSLLSGMPVRLLFALKWNLCKLVWTLNAIKEKKETTKEEQS
ncbi:MAG: 50S ribosomal protein L10 [Deltaproteobacteria bacterium]|nr:50S ribosomal protein L10 [Deltaproteobacteria bacterium]